MSYSRWGEETPNPGLKKKSAFWKKLRLDLKMKKDLMLVEWLEALAQDQEVSGSIPATSELFSSESLMLKK